MVKLEIQGLNLEVTAAIEQYLKKKLFRATKNTEEFISSIKVNLSFEARTESHAVEIIVLTNRGKTIRNCSHTDDMYASIDITCSSIARQLRKYKEKLIDVRRHRSLQEKFQVTDDVISIAS